jgi:hypothetical protein
MRPKRFVEALMDLKFSDVLDDRDVQRVLGLLTEATEHSEDHVLVGFRVRGSVFRVVWAVIEVIPRGTLTDNKDLSPGLPPSEAGYEGWDFQLDRLTFSEGPTAELADLDDAKPPDFKDSPAILVSYPGRVSWDKLRQTTERLFL